MNSKRVVDKHKLKVGLVPAKAGSSTPVRPNIRESIWTRRLPCLPVKEISEKQILPDLHYNIVLRIFRLARADTFNREKLVVLRSLGEAWRLIIDNYHLPFCCEPASFWDPYIAKDPEEALSRSAEKHFKFPQDIQLFHELCDLPHNPFPTREMKLWCQAKLSPLENFNSSFCSIGKHLWSLTYVIGPSIDSIILLFDLLSKLPYLEDLRVIENEPQIIQEDLDRLKKPPKTGPLPELNLPPYPPTKLTCLSVTGSDDPFVLDQLLTAYGRCRTIECLEMQGPAIKRSTFLKPLSPTPHKGLVNLRKLAVCGRNDGIFNRLDTHHWEFHLTHVSLTMPCDGDSALGSRKLLEWNAMQWLFWTRGIKELYLYFDKLDEIGEPAPPEIQFQKDIYTVRKLGLPYQFVKWDCWALTNCPHVEEIEFHNWAATVGTTRREANASKLLEPEKTVMRSEIGKYKRLFYLRKVTVCFGVTDEKAVVFRKEDLMHPHYENDDEDYGYSWR